MAQVIQSEANIALRSSIDFANTLLAGAPGLLERNDPAVQNILAEARPRVEKMVAEQRERERNLPVAKEAKAEAEKPEQKDED